MEGGSDRTVASFRHAGHDHARSLVGRAERVTWTAPDGLEIDGFLLAPEGDGPHPLILQIHGGPVWSYQESFPRPSLSWLVSRGYAILMPNPRGSTGRGRAFLEAVIGDMGGEDARDDLAGVDAMVERGDADPERIGVTGGSYGGYMSCWLPVVDQRFKAAVAISPVTDYYSQHWNSNIGEWDSWFLGGRPEDGAEQLPRAEPGVLRGPGDDADAPHRRDGGSLHTSRAGDGVLPRAPCTSRAGRGRDLPRRRTRGEEVPRVSRPGHAHDGLVRAIHARARSIDGSHRLARRVPGPGAQDVPDQRVAGTGLAPLDRRTCEEYMDAWGTKGAPDHVWFEDIFPRMGALKRSFSALAGCDPDEVALTTNISIALSTIASCLDFSGDRRTVILSELDFPTDGHVWIAWAREDGCGDHVAAQSRRPDDPARGVRPRDRRSDRARDGQSGALPIERDRRREGGLRDRARRGARSPSSTTTTVSGSCRWTSTTSGATSTRPAS